MMNAHCTNVVHLTIELSMIMNRTKSTIYRRHEIPRCIGITVFCDGIYYRPVFLDTAQPYVGLHMLCGITLQVDSCHDNNQARAPAASRQYLGNDMAAPNLLIASSPVLARRL